MKRTPIFALLALSSVVLAQDNRGWRRVTEPPANPDSSTSTAQNIPVAQENAPDPQNEPAPPPPPPNWNPQSRDAYGQSRGTARPGPMLEQAPANIPPELTLRPGTFVSVRIDQHLSSDRNHPGDPFSGTLMRPIIVDGLVVAQRGEMVAGHVAEAEKAGRVSGTSRLGLELTDITLVDGQQIHVRSPLISFQGPTSNGRDAQAIGTTTAVGAAAGAIADGGVGAGIGAGAGAAAGIIGVLLTRGHATQIFPESVLTFRIDAPAMISTVRAPYAFHQVDPREYERAASAPRLQARMAPPTPYYGDNNYYGGGYYGGYYSPYYYSPYYWGPGFSFYYGPRYGFYGYRGGGYYRGGGFYRGGGGHRR